MSTIPPLAFLYLHSYVCETDRGLDSFCRDTSRRTAGEVRCGSHEGHMCLWWETYLVLKMGNTFLMSENVSDGRSFQSATSVSGGGFYWKCILGTQTEISQPLHTASIILSGR